ncbi:hypothetical protein GLYMA_13G093200v4 [Glycine max]|uniref:Uncharacterized protein n=1 Tax=Glycine max TaxID=3847 RepID=A0A0R0GKK6_SOYBN|nr:hypothetical protein GYH30_035630 [Glycine max]KRH18972.1 hypothetical protein GLYMA_13G093200v4 [Glycine max]
MSCVITKELLLCGSIGIGIDVPLNLNLDLVFLRDTLHISCYLPVLLLYPKYWLSICVSVYTSFEYFCLKKKQCTDLLCFL